MQIHAKCTTTPLFLINNIINRAIINPQNSDEHYFKWTILTKYILIDNIQHVVKISDKIKIFEKKIIWKKVHEVAKYFMETVVDKVRKGW